MNMESWEVRIRGREQNVPSIQIQGSRIIATGRWLKTAELFDEELVEEADYPDPFTLVDQLKASPLSADLFTFAGRGARAGRRFSFPCYWDNWAVVSTESFDEWWKALPQEARKNTRLATKRGVVTKPVVFDDALVQGIKCIYDETPVRQGRRFWHYRKDLENVRKMNATYLDRSHFLGAFFEDRLIGFIKYIRVDNVAVLIQILAMEAFRDKRPMYALLKHAMEMCQLQGLAMIVYGKFNYGINQNSTLSEFKRRTGFREMRFPRYVVPLTTKGKLATSAGLHLGVSNLMPLPLKTALFNGRSWVMRHMKNASARAGS